MSYSYDRTAADSSLKEKAAKLEASIKALESVRDLLDDPEVLDPKLLPKAFQVNVKAYNRDLEKAASAGSLRLNEVLRNQRYLLEYIKSNLDSSG